MRSYLDARWLEWIFSWKEKNTMVLSAGEWRIRWSPLKKQSTQESATRFKYEQESGVQSGSSLCVRRYQFLPRETRETLLLTSQDILLVRGSPDEWRRLSLHGQKLFGQLCHCSVSSECESERRGDTYTLVCCFARHRIEQT